MPTGKLVSPHNERDNLLNYNRWKHGREKDNRKTENDVIGLNDDRRLQQVEGESWTSWSMTTLDVRIQED